jgi:uncharacterized membrane protein
MAMGCSTNAVIHILAMARRAGHDIGLADFDAASRKIPVIANVRPSGDTYLMVNVGGALVPIILVGYWIRRGKLRLIAAIAGTALVTAIAASIVVLDPDRGIVSTFPYFFLPVAAALVYALVVSIHKPLSGTPIAYAAGSLGALFGADVMHLPEIHAHFKAAPEGSLISIGGAGVFDMVFLAGTSAMALHLTIVAILSAKGRLPRAAAIEATYPMAPLSLRDSRRVADHFKHVHQPNPLERALAGVAMSNLALKDGEFPKSDRMSWLAVDNLLQTDNVKTYLANGVAPGVHADLRRLETTYQHARAGHATLREAGDANTTAKILLTTLAPHTGLRHHLEGVA